MAIHLATYLILLITAFYLLVAMAENFDPALADPRGSLTCLGDWYPLILPVVGIFNPNLVTMQQLCAKPQYNGGQPGQHMGGWYSFNSSLGRGSRVASDQLQRVEAFVAFDVSAGAQVNDFLANERVMLACVYKCFCTNQLADLQTQPINRGLHSDLSNEVGTEESYDLTLDVVSDFTDRSQKVQPPRPGVDQGLELVLRTQAQVFDDSNPWFITLNPANNLTCRGDLPTFPLPMTFPEEDGFTENDDPFTDLQKLCANQFAGGSK
ncbi:hypothetical protein MMC21_007679 [Puttea exsequens]|nr:hypothetical protein [Puttea exsequens]